jgi:hypothetical protein
MNRWFNPFTLVLFICIIGTSPLWIMLAVIFWCGVIEPMWFMWLGLFILGVYKYIRAKGTLG